MLDRLNKAFTYMYLACAVTMTFSTIFTFRHIYLNSKSVFAYLLLAFTVCLIVHDTARFSEYVSGYENFYYYESVLYFYFLFNNQTWIFAQQYL